MERSRKMIIVSQETLAQLQSAAAAAAAGAASVARDNDGGGDDDSTQTPGDILSRLDAEMHKILRSKNFDDISEKCKSYLQVLRRYLFFKDRERLEQILTGTDASNGAATSAANVSKDERDDEEDEERDTIVDPDTVSPLSARRQQRSQRLTEDVVLAGVPKVHARKAGLLLRHWRNQAPERLDWDGEGAIRLDGRLLKRTSIVQLLNELLTKSNARRRVGASRGAKNDSKQQQQQQQQYRRGNEDNDDDDDDDEDTSIARRLLRNFVATSKTPYALINNPRYRGNERSGIDTRSKLVAPATTTATATTVTRRGKRPRDESYEAFDPPDHDPRQQGQPRKKKKRSKPSTTDSSPPPPSSSSSRRVTRWLSSGKI